MQVEKKDLTTGRKAGTLIGMPIYTLDDGKRIGTVKDVVYDADNAQLTDLTVEEHGVFTTDRKILPYESIKSVGRDAIMVENAHVLLAPRAAPDASKALHHRATLAGKTVLTVSGNNLGSITDVLVDDASGRAVSYEVTGGMAKDIGSGRNYVEATKPVVIGKDAVIVPDEVETTLQAQAPGGLSAVYEEIMTRGREYGRGVSQYTQQQEIALVRGKVAGQDVVDDQGLPIVAKGEAVTDEVIDHALTANKLHQLAMATGVGAVAGGYTSAREAALAAAGGRLQGRVVPRDITNPDGDVIIPKGTVITDETIAHAREEGVLSPMASAVLGEAARGAGETARGRASSLWDETKERASEAWHNITESTRESAVRTNRRRAELEQRAFLKGKIAANDIVSPSSGQVLLHKGEVITPLILDTLDREGVLETVQPMHEEFTEPGVHGKGEEVEVHATIERPEGQH